MKDFKNLMVWKKGIKLVVETYNVTRKFPSEEMYRLTSQLRRSSISIPSNIAEGADRNSDKDFHRFLDISLGSSFELETQIIIAFELKSITENEFSDIIEKIQEIQKMISGLQKSLK